MTKLSLFLLLAVALSGCQKDALNPDDGTLSGSFRLEVDPLRCSLPTTQKLTIQPMGSNTYQFNYDRFGLGSYKRAGIVAVKSSATKYELMLNGQLIGQYAFEELRSLSGTQTRWVLMVSHEVRQPDGLEFMGVKE